MLSGGSFVKGYDSDLLCAKVPSPTICPEPISDFIFGRKILLPFTEILSREHSVDVL